MDEVIGLEVDFANCHDDLGRQVAMRPTLTAGGAGNEGDLPTHTPPDRETVFQGSDSRAEQSASPTSPTPKPAPRETSGRVVASAR
jgi:hypothetical protein